MRSIGKRLHSWWQWRMWYLDCWMIDHPSDVLALNIGITVISCAITMVNVCIILWHLGRLLW